MINRRLFLKQIFYSFILLPLGIVTKAEAEHQCNQTKAQQRWVMLNRFSVAGFQYYQGREIVGDLEQNDELDLLIEPDNEQDQYAVEIFYQNKKLGYVPKTDNRHISRLLGSGVPLQCKVMSLNLEKHAWDVVMVEVFIQV